MMQDNKQEVEDYQNKVTMRFFIEKILTSKFGRYFEIFSACGSFISCVLYIASTYMETGILWLEDIDLVVMIVYFVEYLLRLFAAQHRLQQAFSVWSIVEIVTMAPVFFLQEQSQTPYLTKLINISRILRFLRVVKVITKYYQVIFTSIIKDRRQ